MQVKNNLVRFFALYSIDDSLIIFNKASQVRVGYAYRGFRTYYIRKSKRKLNFAVLRFFVTYYRKKYNLKRNFFQHFKNYFQILMFAMTSGHYYIQGICY